MKDLYTMKIIYYDVPEPVAEEGRGFEKNYNLGPRAIIGATKHEGLRPKRVNGNQLYESIFNFQSWIREPNMHLNSWWSISPVGDYTYRMELPVNEIVVVGLGIIIDHGSLSWLRGSISVRRDWMFDGLWLVNANTPIYGNSGEIFAIVWNNGAKPIVLDRKSKPFQLHFEQGLMYPNIEVVCAETFAI
jgi:hypothetical protein